VKRIIISLLYNNAVILTISSEENSVAFYLKSEMNSYYSSLVIWNSNTKEYPDNYAPAIRHNVMLWRMAEA